MHGAIRGRPSAPFCSPGTARKVNQRAENMSSPFLHVLSLQGQCNHVLVDLSFLARHLSFGFLDGEPPQVELSSDSAHSDT